MHWNWSQLCGRGVESLTVWTHNDFAHCFELLTFVCTTHALFAVISAYYAGQHRHAVLRAVFLPRYWVLHVRFLCAILFFLLPVLFAVLTRTYLEIRMSLIDVGTVCVTSGSWLIHAVFVARLHFDLTRTLRGPSSLMISFFLTFASQGIQLRTIILDVSHHSKYLNKVEEYEGFISFTLYIVYSLTLIPSKRHTLVEGRNYSIQDIDTSTEDTSLLGNRNVSHTRYHTQSGNEQDGMPLGRAEEGTNCLSKLFFCWVNPLMLKGSRRKLSSPADLFVLPKPLDTAKIEDYFKSVISAYNTQSSATHSQPADVEFRGPDQSQDFIRKPLTLLGALNKAYGLHYYSLGILKLMADMLGFCGPVLLNLLVSYMENSMEPAQHGYLYAGGLFLSTFLVAMLSTHFTYQVQVRYNFEIIIYTAN